MTRPPGSGADSNDAVSILSATTAVTPAAPDTRCAEAYQRFRDNPDLMAIPVVDDGRPIGLVDRHDLSMSLAQDYGRALYAQKPITARMDRKVLIVESTVTIDALEWMIAVKQPSALTRGFIVVCDGIYAGVGTALTLLQLSIARNDERSRQLEEARCAAESANRAKSTFLATMSHELRTPLNAIIGFSDFMVKEVLGPISPPEYVGYLQDINVSAHTLLALINDILDTAKIDSGQMQLFEEPVDVSEQLAAAVRMLAPRAAIGGVSLDTRVPQVVPVLLADQRAVRQILLNLLSNAIKFSPKGSVLGLIEERAGGELALVVTDTGIGMAAEEIEIALTPFGQIANQHTRTHDGSGLGLPLVQRLAELHSAKFTIESEPGVGTTVAVIFPSSRLLRSAEPSIASAAPLCLTATG